MKKIILLSLLLCLILTGCGDISDKKAVVSKNSINFETQTIWTYYGEKENDSYPKMAWITSVSELDDYYNDNSKFYKLGEKTHEDSEDYKIDGSSTHRSKVPDCFVHATKKYDEDFFKNNNLIFYIVEEGETGPDYKLSKLSLEPSESDDKKHCIKAVIDRISPEVMTHAIAGPCHIVAEISKEYGPDNCEIANPEINTTVYQYVEPESEDDFSSQIIITTFKGRSMERVKELWITNQEELNDYYEANKDIRDLDNADETISFKEAIEKYNDKFFEKHNIILVNFDEEVKDLKYSVNNLFYQSTYFDNSVYYIYPEISLTYEGGGEIPDDKKTDDTECFCLIEVSKDYGPSKYEINAIINYAE